MAIPNFVQLEKDILKRWKNEDVFRQTLVKDAPKGKFVFFEGPPTANGRPHIGHVETRVFKDLIPRFKTMQGYRVVRKAGWDTQGLPVELEVEKQIGVSGKKDIEAYGIEKFNEACKASVWKYKGLWEEMTERVGFWLDLEHPYITYENSYIETLWWILKQAWDAGLLVQDYKVVPYCYRCGTALSSHEVAQGYERVRDRSLYVKFELEDEPGTFVLAWTTTPWTLPGNVALAVDPKIDYMKTAPNEEGQRFIVAVKRANALKHTDVTAGVAEETQKPVVQQTIKGSELVGKHYTPLFDFLDLRKDVRIPERSKGSPPPTSSRNGDPLLRSAQEYKNAYTVVPADFVTTQEGTGVVHTAVMYGVDDFELGSKLDLPKKHTVNEDGTFNELVKPWAGKNVKARETEEAIVEYLTEHGKLYKEEQYEHDYPFCWRCKSPLLYYAKTSWFILMSKLRSELIANNENITWVPEHIKEGRFGEWLREVKDWAISRERYWGTPLPIWVCDHCKHQECFGSYEDLLNKLPTRNRFVFVRHGEAENNVGKRLNTLPEHLEEFPLTKRGRQQAEATAKSLAQVKADAVFTSQFRRTRETAEIIGKHLGIPVRQDERLHEINLGRAFEGKTEQEYHATFVTSHNRFREAPEGGETWYDVRKRMMGLLLELDGRHDGKTFVIVAHGDPIWIALWACSLGSEGQIDETNYPKYGQALELRLASGVFQPDGSFDPHRPFIDNVTWSCPNCAPSVPGSSHPSVPRLRPFGLELMAERSGHLPSSRGGVMRRVPEVADTWFDSGSMPFSQWHYPFENRKKVEQGEVYPAQFISEAIDQTRGWFYTLLAVATILQHTKNIKLGPPYEACVVLGHIRDKQGRKLSKSLGNYIDPMRLLEKYGADAIRMYFFTVNQPSEPKNFDEDNVGEVVKKTFLILWNVLSFWKLLNQQSEVRGRKSENLIYPTSDNRRPTSKHVMDKWILARLDMLNGKVTAHLEKYEIVEAGRALTAFVTDLSTWYVRRSRERAKGDGKQAVANTLGYVLRQYAKLSAPFTPFLSDALWRELGNTSSVHLEEWSPAHKPDEKILEAMEDVRKIVETGHAVRAMAKLRVRQPLSQLVLIGMKLGEDFRQIAADELNVKEVHTMQAAPTGKEWKTLNNVALDTTVTDELREEGYLREMVRAINALRKALRLKPGERAAMVYACDDQAAKYVEHFERTLMEKGSLSSLKRVDVIAESSVVAELDEKNVMFGKG